jgi:hypothetical protein
MDERIVLLRKALEKSAAIEAAQRSGQRKPKRRLGHTNA